MAELGKGISVPLSIADRAVYTVLTQMAFKLNHEVNTALVGTGLTSSDIGVTIQAYRLILDNITAAYTVAEQDKLAGISAGATVGGDTVFKDEGSTIVTGGIANFVGAGVVVTDVGGTATVTIDGGGGGGAVDSVNTQVGVVVLDTDDILDTSQINKYTTAADITKLSGIATGATNTTDYTASEIKTLYEGELKAFTDAQYDKLALIEAAATGDLTASEIKVLYESNSGTNVFSDTQLAKLAGIEIGATRDQTGAEIKADYEDEADTNAYDDNAVNKLAGITPNATIGVGVSDEGISLNTGSTNLNFKGTGVSALDVGGGTTDITIDTGAASSDVAVAMAIALG
jgi:hypothetical protein